MSFVCSVLLPMICGVLGYECGRLCERYKNEKKTDEGSCVMGRVKSCFICRGRGDIFECIKQLKESMTNSVMGQVGSGTDVRIDGGYLKELLDFAIRQKEEVERLGNEDIKELHNQIKEAERDKRIAEAIRNLEKELEEQRSLIVSKMGERMCGRGQKLIEQAKAEARTELLERLRERLRQDVDYYIAQGDFKSMAAIKKAFRHLNAEENRRYEQD